jgi:hypothetical protein
MGDVSDLTAVSSGELLVGISVSEPADEELLRLGLSELHVRHVFIEIVRHVLAAGWSVAYGGDFRARGYTEALLDLVRTYERTTLSGPEQVRCYLAWPRWTEFTDADRAELANVATIVEAAAPDGAPDSLGQAADRSLDERLWNALALTSMRQQMAGNLGAAVIVGGRVAGQQGLVPGVAEEAVIALAADVPLFVAGGFGGCGRLIARTLEGENPEELSVGYQRAHTDGYPELFDAATSANALPDYDALIADLSSRGVGGLGNGLSENENRCLLATDDVDELIALVLRGLFRIAGDRDC